MSHHPTLVIDFPHAADRSLLHLGFGLAGTWGAALYAFGANVLIIDAPGDSDPDRARLEGRLTPLTRDAELPDAPEALLLLRLERTPAYHVFHARLESPPGEILYERSTDGDEVRIVQACEALVLDVAELLGLEVHPIHWRNLFAPAITPQEALDTIEQVGALALSNRAGPGRTGAHAPLVH